ncbi:LuxR C-terminal-related transcriptional regulator, partial [Ralstonia sp.]
REYAEVEWLMAAGEFDGAYKRLEALAQTAEAAGRTYRAVQFQVRIATLLHRSGRPSDAIAHLVSALSISEASGMRRTFLDEGLSMKLLLDSLLESPPTGLSEPTLAYARSLAVLLQTLCPEVPPDSLPSRQTTDPLSQREREILELVAKARSNKEIARHLAISPETVKWHLKNIYGKLTAMNRRDAVRKGSFL